jgi:tetratricopeptide (TPR) repeat protein/transcriptional regulator with XRE-family HTH domain
MGVTDTASTTFGAYLRLLRRRARITQRELGLRVGYSEGHVCRLEQDRRVPELSVLAALFVPALGLARDPASAARLMDLARQARGLQVEGGADAAGDAPGRAMSRIPDPPTHAVDRPEALARLADLIGTERVVVLQGLAGTGKTTLAAAYAQARAAQEAVCWITATPGVTASPEALVRQLAVHLAEQSRPGVAALTEPSDAAPLPLDRQVDVLAGALAQRPTLVCLDNAQEVAGDVVATLAHLAATAGIRLLLVSRTSVDLPGPASLRLAGLDRAQGLDLVARLDPRMPPELAGRLCERTAGNPMLLRLALGQARASGADRARLVDGLATNPELGDYLVRTTLDQLGRPALRLMALLAVLRVPVDLYDEVLAEESRALDGPDDLLSADLLSAADELRQRQLIDDPAAAELHPLVRDQTFARLVGDPALRRRMHRIAAAWADRSRDDALDAAWHFREAGQYGDAVDALADRVRALIGRGQALEAADLVVALRDRLRRRPDAQPELLRQVHVLLGDLLVDTTRADEAEAAYRAALAGDLPPAVWAAVARRLAESLLHRGQVPRALELCLAAASRLGTQDTVLRAELAATQARARLQLSEHDEALRLGEEALGLAERVGAIEPGLADDLAAKAGFTVAVVHRLRRRFPQAAGHFRAAAERANRADLHHLAERCAFNLAALRLEQGDLFEPLRLYTDLADRMRATGDSFGLARVLHSLGLIRHCRGEVTAGLELYEQACALKRQTGDVQGLANSQMGRALTLRSMGRVDEALAALEGILAGPAAHSEPWSRTNYLDSYATTLLVAGRVDEAFELLSEAVELARETGGLYEHVIWQHLAVAKLASGDPDSAAQLAASRPPDPESLLEAHLDARLLAAALALARQDAAELETTTRELSRWVEATGYALHRATPAVLRGAAGPGLALAALPRLIWVEGCLLASSTVDNRGAG